MTDGIHLRRKTVREKEIKIELLKEGYVALKSNEIYEQWVDIVKNGMDIWRYKPDQDGDEILMFVGPSLGFAHTVRCVHEAIKRSRKLVGF